MGKVKNFISEKVALVKGKVSPLVNKVKEKFKGFTEKHKIDKAYIQNAANNTGATLVAVPSAVTAINETLEAEDGGEE